MSLEKLEDLPLRRIDVKDYALHPSECTKVVYRRCALRPTNPDSNRDHKPRTLQ